MIITLEEYKEIKGIADTSQDKLISSLIPHIEEDYFFIRGKAHSEDEAYPLGSKLVAADMLTYRLEQMNLLGITSESIGDYSVSYETSSASYPLSIVKRIKRYLEVH